VPRHDEYVAGDGVDEEADGVPERPAAERPALDDHRESRVLFVSQPSAC
jgi:hypothetical protein